ncbi:MAG: hypothetical protein RL637_576, partial [Pseudomonadota bacterium]
KNTGEFNYLPNSNDVVGDQFSYQISDGNGGFSSATVKIEVNVVNQPLQPPIVSLPDRVETVIENGQTVVVSVLQPEQLNNFALNSLQIVGTNQPGEDLAIDTQGIWIINSSQGEIIFKPNANFEGNPDPIQYTIKTNTGLINQSVIRIEYTQPFSINSGILTSTITNSNSFIGDSTTKLIGESFVNNFVQNTALNIKNGQNYYHEYQLTPLYEVNYNSILDPSINPVSMSGELRDQFADEGKLIYTVSDKFKHTNPSIPLKFHAALPNGTALPEYVKFDQKTGQFIFDAEQARSQGAKSVLIRVVAADPLNNQVSSVFETRFDHPSLGKNPIKLNGLLANQKLTKGQRHYVIPSNAFTHNNPNETLTYQANVANGSALPDCVRFNEKTHSFDFDADYAQKLGIKKLTLKLTAKDSQKHQASTNFVIDFTNRAADTEQTSLPENSTVQENSKSTSEPQQSSEREMDRFLALLAQNPSSTKPQTQSVETSSMNERQTLTHQIHRAGFFGYQQTKQQLIADFISLFSRNS